MAGSVQERDGSARNRTFDLMRLVFAYLVLVSHSYDLTGPPGLEPLRRWTGHAESLGTMSVYGFFLLSGYLIMASWVKDPVFSDFAAKRALRILPGYAVALTLSVVLAGLIAPATPHFFHDLFHAPMRNEFVRTTVLMDSPMTPPAFPGNLAHAVNGSLWSLQFESRAYILVGLLGLLGLARRPYIWLVATIGIGLLDRFRPFFDVYHPLMKYGVLDCYSAPWLFFPFFVGGCFYLYRRWIPFHPAMDVLAIAVFVRSGLMGHVTFFKPLILAFAYLLFRLARLRAPNRGWIAQVPDISYGVYIFGYPIQQFLLHFFHLRALALMPASMVAATVAGLLSWYLVERPMLELKPRPSVPLDPSPEAAPMGEQRAVA